MAKVNRQEYHLQLKHIAQLLGMLDDSDKTYFKNMQLEHLLAEFVKREVLDGIVVTMGTTLTNLVRARDLTGLATVFWQVIGTNILAHIGHLMNTHHMLSTPYGGSPPGKGSTCHPSSSTAFGYV